ncbi:hypothetical protein SAY86_006201 [Trapa natans]|uniref:Uncharacterized protein n=1 Tax=Trapa natans TaxID=22666 RepID=A0AAN7L9B9_TRANT|nr:hypothetical protein SAY86_006201 [Trapa natans]
MGWLSTSLHLCQWRPFDVQLLIGGQKLNGSCNKSVFNRRGVGGGGGGGIGLDGKRRPFPIILEKRSPNSVLPKCSFSEGAGASGESFQGEDNQSRQAEGFWSKWKANSAELSAKLAKLGLAAVLAYGLFDGVTYTTFFILAFLGYEKSTGKNPAANLQALLGIVILMWAGNNVTRPFRVAGAAALAPVIDKGLKKIQKYFNFPNLFFAFALVVSIVASTCLSIIGLLILSRWGK